MFNLHKSTIKYIVIYLLVMCFFLIFVPFCAIKFFTRSAEEEPLAPYSGTIPDTVRIYITEKKTYKTIDFENYIEGVVAAEMPSSFHFEALKAQAVASRTYALGRINAGTPICDTVHCQVYRSDHIPAKVKKAVQATKGQVLLYDGSLAAQALYFSSSAGATENAEDVFSNPYPYLVSVSSSYEPGATHTEEELKMIIKEFANTIKEACPELNFGTIKKSNIKILTHTKGGRVGTVKVGSQTLSGSDIRKIFNLYSTRFTFRFEDKSILITSSGSGHGVGMSQYGAEYFAKQGKNYQEILKTYYADVKITR